jgi:Bacterial regulatory proteins, luxR family
LSNAEIANQLNMSIATVKAHVSRLLSKLGVDNRVQIALLVYQASTGPTSRTGGLLDSSPRRHGDRSTS